MLTTVTATTSQGTQLELPLEDPSSGYLIENIDGLGPVKATIVSSSFAQQDGQQYHSSKREARNLKIRAELEPDYTMETVRELRNRLYHFFMPKSKVKLSFHIIEGEGVLDFLDVDIVGVVESCDPPLFVAEPAVDISIMCHEPDFLNPIPVTVSGVSTAGPTGQIIDYKGNVETGIIFTLRPDRDITAFTIYHVLPNNTLQTLDFNGELIADDVLTISTLSGAKSATLRRANVESSVVYTVSPQSKWIEFENGKNDIRVYTTGDPIPFDIEYITRYGAL